MSDRHDEHHSAVNRDHDGEVEGKIDAQPTSDDAWLEQLRDAYGPDPMTPAERLAFDARLESRIETESSRGFLRWLGVGSWQGMRPWQPALALAFAALAAWSISTLLLAPTDSTPPPRVAVQIPASLDAWEHEVLAAGEPGAEPARSGSEALLPDDYRAIAGYFLGGEKADAPREK